MRFSRFMVWATAAVWGVSAAFGGEVRFSGIEVKAPANPAAKGAVPGVTVRGEGTAKEAYELQWTPTLGADADWRTVGNATAGDDGKFAVDAFGSAGFFRMALPGRVSRSVSKRAVVGTIDRLTELRTSTNIVQAFDTSFYVEATLSTLVLSGSGRSGQPLAGQPVKFEINGGTWVQNTDENGQVRFGPFVHWPIRTSTGTIRFEGAQGLSPCSESVTVAITKASSKIALSSTNLVIGIKPAQKLVFWLKDSHNAGLTNQTVTMLINGATFTLRTDGKGRVTWTPNNFKAGTYKTRFSFAGSATHESASKTVKLHLAWAVQIGAYNKTYNVSSRNKRYTASFKDYTGKALAKQSIRFKISGKTYTKKTDAKGQATLNIPRLKKGTYKIVVYFNGNSRYRSLNKTVTITVLSSQATQLAVPDETYFSSEPNKPYTAYLQTEDEVLGKETLTFTIDGKTYTAKTDAQGRATLRLPSMKTGNHKMTVKFAGRGGFKASKKSATVAIRGTKPLPMLTARNKTYNIKATDLLYTATLKTPDGLALRNGTITFTLNNHYTQKTDANGHTTISLPQLDAGVYPMVVEYPGSAKYPASIKKVKITISKFLPKLTADNKTYSIHAAKRLYTATLKTQSGQGLPDGTVTFTINGQTYTQKTNDKGQAVTKLPNLAEGVHSMVVRFSGSPYYQAVRKTVKITITQ